VGYFGFIASNPMRLHGSFVQCKADNAVTGFICDGYNLIREAK